MARITHQERLKRLQEEYAKIVTPIAIIGQFVDDTTNINTTIIFNTLLREYKQVTAEGFKALIEQYPDCDVILEDTICQISKNTHRNMFKTLDIRELKELESEGLTLEMVTELVFSTLNNTVFSS